MPDCQVEGMEGAATVKRVVKRHSQEWYDSDILILIHTP